MASSCCTVSSTKHYETYFPVNVPRLTVPVICFLIALGSALLLGWNSSVQRSSGHHFGVCPVSGIGSRLWASSGLALRAPPPPPRSSPPLASALGCCCSAEWAQASGPGLGCRRKDASVRATRPQARCGRSVFLTQHEVHRVGGLSA